MWAGGAAVPQDPDALVDVTTAYSEFEAAFIKDELASHGIAAEALSVATATTQAYTNQAIRIAVRRADLERAAAVLEKFRGDPKVPDWSGIDTGDTSPLTKAELAGMSTLCTKCGYELSGLDLEKVMHCPECGILLAQKPPVTDFRAYQKRDAKKDRAVQWIIGVVIALCVLVALFMIVSTW
jgi:DNA-directed RNA polymerase subunit RPC12/RpoP